MQKYGQVLMTTLRKSILRHELLILLLAGAFFAFFFDLMWPGDYSADSANAEWQWKTNFYTNHHPPMMAWVWGKMAWLTMGNRGSLLLLHHVLFWATIFVIAKINLRISTPWAYAALFTIIIPPVLAMENVLWKDTSAASALSLACAIMTCYSLQKKQLQTTTCLLVTALLFYAVGVRHNVITCIPPLAYWLVSLTRNNTDEGSFHSTSTLKKNLAIALVITIALFSGKTIFEKAIVGKYTAAWQENMLFDLGYMSQRLGKQLLPDYVLQDKGMDFTVFQRKVHFSWAGRWMSDEFGTRNPQKWELLKQAYFDMIRNYPREYLEHRLFMFRGTLGLNGYTYWAFMWNSDNNDPRPLHRQAFLYLKYTGSSLFFAAYFWSLLSLLLLFAGTFRLLPRGLNAPVFYINMSVLCCTIPYFFITPSADFRYYYWTVMGVVISFLLLLPHWDKFISLNINRVLQKYKIIN